MGTMLTFEVLFVNQAMAAHIVMLIVHESALWPDTRLKGVK